MLELQDGFEVGQQIGYGGQARIFEGIMQLEVAVKIPNDSLSNALWPEHNAAAALPPHSNICHVYGEVELPSREVNCSGLLMERCDSSVDRVLSSRCAIIIPS